MADCSYSDKSAHCCTSEVLGTRCVAVESGAPYQKPPLQLQPMDEQLHRSEALVESSRLEIAVPEQPPKELTTDWQATVKPSESSHLKFNDKGDGVENVSEREFIIVRRGDARTGGTEPNGNGGVGKTTVEYECRFCGRRCRWRSSISVHIRTHTGRKPYPCRACHLSYSDSSTRKKHEIKTHNRIFDAQPVKLPTITNTAAAQTSKEKPAEVVWRCSCCLLALGSSVELADHFNQCPSRSAQMAPPYLRELFSAPISEFCQKWPGLEMQAPTGACNQPADQSPSLLMQQQLPRDCHQDRIPLPDANRQGHTFCYSEALQQADDAALQMLNGGVETRLELPADEYLGLGVTDVCNYSFTQGLMMDISQQW